MSWNLEGLHVEGNYMGLFEVRGVVDESRVKYGGEVAHHIALDTPIEVYGQMRDRVILEHKYVTRVRSNAEALAAQTESTN